MLDLMAERYQGRFPPGVGAEAWQFPEAIDEDEWTTARPAPDCIVDGFLYADVGVYVAPGGTGKTTLNIFSAVHIALGLPLFGLEVRRPGPVLILTAEDSREMLVARLRAICKDLNLTANEVARVRSLIRISDVSANPCKLTTVVEDVVRPNHVVEEIIASSRSNPPVLIIIDPAVSFGVGESRVNDAEQGLIEAGRKLRGALNCCVLYVHHSGKANAREKAIDQYAGRGGSAFADGARMVIVLSAYNSTEAAQWQKLTGYSLEEGDTGIVLARPKMSYAPPQENIFIVRRGYHFEAITPQKVGGWAEIEATANQVWQLLCDEIKNQRYHTRNTLESMCKSANLKRQDIRDSIRFLAASGRIEERDKPASGKGGAHRYLHPIASPKTHGEAIVGGAL